MNDADLELLLYRIISGKIKFYYMQEPYEVRPPSSEIKYEAQLLYDNIINDEKFNDWIREYDLDYLLINLGLWSRDTSIIIKDIDKKIEQSKVDLFLNYMLTDRIKKIQKNLNSYRNQLNDIMHHRYELHSNTLEGYASSIKNEYIICNTLFKNNKLLFNYNNINNQTSYVNFNNIVMEINKQNISLEQYKQLARHNLWRSYWGCNKENIFANSVADWTDEQRTLVNISRMYDNVYSHPECPEDKIIENDDMLDGWMIHQQNLIKKNKKQEQIDKMNPKLKNAQEVFITPQGAEEISDIINLNSDLGLAKIKARSNVINKHGSVDAINLPDVQNDMREQVMAANTKNRK
jgi:hypothetical protein